MLIVILLIYLFIFGQLATLLLRQFFGFTKNFSTLVLGMFLVGVTASWLGGLALIFFTWQPVTFASVLVLNGLLYVPALRYKKSSYSQDSSVAQPDNAMRVDVWTVLGVVVFFACLVYGFILLSQSRSGHAILTPWQTISPLYIYVFFIATFTLGLLIFSSLKTKTLLLFLILQTFLLHSYLPMSHKFIYGADGWRHIANEQRFLEGKKFLQPQLAGVSEHGSSIMENFQSKIGQLSYGNFWAANIMLAQIFKTDLITITKWFLPVLWSLVFPLLLFELGLLFGWGDKKSLFFSWLGLWPFAWHAAGSFSLPVNFGFLIFLFGFVLIAQRILKQSVSGQILLLVFYGFGMLCGYSLYALLFWLLWLVAELIVYTSARRVVSRFLVLGAVVSAALVIPVIEMIVGYSYFDPNLNWLDQVKQSAGNFLGIYLASGPRSHDISFGNIIFNQVPSNAFVSNIFIAWRWWVVAVMLAFLLSVVYGAKQILRYENKLGVWFGFGASVVLGGYEISNYFLTGNHIISRRLDSLVALVLVLLCFYGLNSLLKHLEHRSVIFVAVVCLFSFVITGSYSLGPDSNTLSDDQYQAIQYVWSQEKNQSTPCVLADVYPLLALEAASSKNIIGGGFPIDANFGQLERVRFFKRLSSDFDIKLSSDIGMLIKSDHCWLVAQKAVIQKQRLDNLKNFNTISVTKLPLIK